MHCSGPRSKPKSESRPLPAPQSEPPKDPETYIHRSGRTGRAGCTGVSVTLVDRKKEGLVPFIERRAGVKFERIGAPQPQEMARIAGMRLAIVALAPSLSFCGGQERAPLAQRPAGRKALAES